MAIKIFDLGLKRFGDRAEFVRIYMELMSNMNDDNNTRFVDNFQPFWLDTIDLFNGDLFGKFSEISHIDETVSNGAIGKILIVLSVSKNFLIINLTYCI